MSTAPLLSVQDLKVHFDVTRKGSGCGTGSRTAG